MKVIEKLIRVRMRCCCCYYNYYGFYRMIKRRRLLKRFVGYKT